jgi:hypothetical protein
MSEPGEAVIEHIEKNHGPKLAQMLEWKRRHVLWLLQRLSGSKEDQEQFLDMWHAALNEAHNEGLDSAADLVRQIASAQTDATAYARLNVAAEAIAKLARKNRMAES